MLDIKFKFQSDSINTIMCIPTNYKITGFKFQSDSINTNIETSSVNISTNLNSNLILLILVVGKTQIIITQPHLNSNLILLIPYPVTM